MYTFSFHLVSHAQEATFTDQHAAGGVMNEEGGVLRGVVLTQEQPEMHLNDMAARAIKKVIRMIIYLKIYRSMIIDRWIDGWIDR